MPGMQTGSRMMDGQSGGIRIAAKHIDNDKITDRRNKRCKA
ncbi:hypothetical protein [Petralouisia muris]|nr:hypothetical protein [Petralouisia muris]